MALDSKFYTVKVPYIKQGGQHVGVTNPGVTVEHMAGITVTSSLARSQNKNKQIALAAVEYALLEAGYNNDNSVFLPHSTDS